MGADFFLYKETNEKVTLSKKELENRIAAGGQVFDRQADYMEYVNRQIFGFDTVEEYKEMIDLLIQLRTPKLSKDFKPSVINDILSDSLQPLSDDDLRPMSDAIENMDQMTMNLKSRREAQQAAQKIQNVYDKYNRLALYEKAKKYQEICDDIEEVDKEQKKRQTDIAGSEEEITSLSGQLEEMQAKHDAMEKERESLSKSDAVGLKDRQPWRQSRNSTGRKKKSKEKKKIVNLKKKKSWESFWKKCRQRQRAWLLRSIVFFRRSVRNIWKKQLHLIRMKSNSQM